MWSLISRRANGIVLGALVFGQILMIGHQVSSGPGETRLRYWTAAVLLPLQQVAQGTVGFVGGAWHRYFWLVGAEAENRQLGAEAARLRLENHFLQQELRRYRSEEELDAFRKGLAAVTLPARVIAQGPSRSSREVFLNRGQGDGVRAGMAVITPEGVVGMVKAVHGGSSMVLLISDTEAGAGVLLGRSGQPGVLRGTSRPTCRVDYIGPHVRVVPGEFVYTSGLDGVFPRGLPVGHVTAVDKGVEIQTIQVRPFAKLGRLEQVLVVLKSDQDLLPDGVRQTLAHSSARWADGPGHPPVISLPTEADRIKLAYRRSVDAQGRRVGTLTYSGPPDFSAAIDPLRVADAPAGNSLEAGR